MHNTIAHTTQQTFAEDVVNATQPVLVDFYADWCGPCQALAPIVDELADTYEGRVTFKKVDVDADYELANRFSVRSIPTLVLFKDDIPVEKIVGSVSSQVLAEMVDRHST